MWNERSWHAEHLHFGCEAVDLWNVGLVVMFGECHTSVQIILIDQLKNCSEDTGIASRHFIDVISVPHDQSLKIERNSLMHATILEKPISCRTCSLQAIILHCELDSI